MAPHSESAEKYGLSHICEYRQDQNANLLIMRLQMIGE